MALTAFLRVESATAGMIRGGSRLRGREGLIEVYGMTHSVNSPRDAASGLPTGKRQHKPFTITKEVDSASPLLWMELASAGALPSVRLDFYRPNASGAEEQYYTVELTNASISDIRMEQLNNKYPENQRHAEREHVSFVYERITWTYQEGGITAFDDWETPRA